MKIYKKKVIPAKEVTVVEQRKCDLCGKIGKDDRWESKSSYEINETVIEIEIRQKEGASYPEGGSGTKYEIDLCPDCFKNRLIPWLQSQGADIKTEEWDW